MGKQRAPRAEKRHLVRWTDDMDKRLLLSIQYVCNIQGINLPWDEICRLMGPYISGGAGVQHLAKLRTRMVDQGLPVPPPLKRGGSSRISTGPSLPARARSSVPKANASSDRIISAKKPGNAAAKRRAPTASDESDDDDSYSDDDGEYGKKPTTKRAKTGIKKHPSPKLKAEEDHLEDEAQDSDNATVKGEDADDDRVVAAGASFLSLEKNVPVYKQSSKGAQAKPSLIVRLPTSLKIDSSGEDDDSTDSSEEYSEDEDEGVEAHAEEDDAIQTLAAMSSKGKGSAKVHADPSTTQAPYNTYRTMHPVMADSHNFDNFDQLSPYNDSIVQPNFGGLPYLYPSLGNNNFPSHHDNFGYFNGSGGFTGPTSYGAGMYDNGHNSYGDVLSLGACGMMTTRPLQNNFGSIDNSRGMHFSNNAGGTNSDLRLQTTTHHPSDLVRGHTHGGDTSLSTVDPTPTSENGTCALSNLSYDRDLIEDAGGYHTFPPTFDNDYSTTY